MKPALVLLSLLSTLSLVSAQEQLSRSEALKYALLVSTDLKQLQGTPIATDADLKHVIALRDGDYGGMILPETKLTREMFSNSSGNVLPVGQLWLLKLTPMRDGERIGSERLRLVTIHHPDGDVTVPQCALGVQRNKTGQLELLVYGKSKEPLLRCPLKKIEATQQSPIEMTSERTNDGAEVTLKFLGSYEATFMVTELDL